MYFPRTTLTHTHAKVTAYFESVGLKARKIKNTMENEKDYWFVKLCEDASPSVKVIKLKVLKLMRKLRNDLHEVGEDRKVFMK